MKIDGRTRLCGLIGNPVEHTMSPAIHNTLADAMGENLVYVPFHVPSGYVGDAVRGIYALNLLGCNVTVPYKSEVIPFLKGLDPLAERIGAVNTLVRTDGGFIGHNTDMPGLYRAMCEDGVEIEGKKVVILGAGGVARAVAMLLKLKGAGEIIILNRTLEKAERIADEVNGAGGNRNVSALELSEYRKLLGGEKFLAIQATSIGMYPKVDEAVITDPDFYGNMYTGYDLVFNPAETKFMSLARENGARAFNGLKMLLYQGIIAYELWTGKEVDSALAKKAFKAMKAEMGIQEESAKNIVLMGFMGSGKTTLGRELACRMKTTVEDTDRLIEKREGMKISEIFSRYGEDYFRRAETKLLSELAESGEGPAVYSLGGGTPVNPENRKLLKRLGTVVWLDIRPETVYERLKGDTTRPLLQCADPLGRIRELIEERKSAYSECADLIVNVDGRDCGAIADEIEQKLIRRAEN